MNNLRLLVGWLCVSTLGSGMWLHAQRVITLEEIFESAEVNSVQLRPSLEAVTESEQALKVARDGRLPEVSASMAVSYIGDGFTTSRALGDYQRAPIPHLGTGLSVTVSQPVYAGGAITNSIGMAELKLTSTRFATELQRDNLRFSLVGFYLDIYKYRNTRGVVEQNLTSARKLLTEMQARYEQGTALLNDITRYELLVSNLELQLVQIDNVLEILNNNLVTIAGLDSGTIVMPDSMLLERALPEGGEGWWLDAAEEHSPTLKIARTGVEISRKAESLVKADRLPHVGINAGWTMDGPILVEIPPINRNLSYWYVGLGVKYNISSLYKSRRTMARSRAATHKAISDLDAARQSVKLSVRADYVNYLEAYEVLKTRTKGVELAERNYGTVTTRYLEGMALITDLLDAANSRLDAQQQLVNARINIIYLYYKLLFTTGKI